MGDPIGDRLKAVMRQHLDAAGITPPPVVDRDALAEVMGKHCPIYDYKAGQFLMECGCHKWNLGGVDRAEAEARFGSHMADAIIASGILRAATEVRAEAKAEALREAADFCTSKNWTGPGATLMHLEGWLRDRADAMEATP